MAIPIIDFRSKTCIEEMHRAYTTCGFAVFTNVYNEWLSEFQDWKHLMEEFFQLPLDVKKKYTYSGVRGSLTCRAGWGEMGHIQSRLGDLKESYNWVDSARMQDQYWPTEIPEFKSSAQQILQISQQLSHQFFDKFESMFKLKKKYLIDKHTSGYVNMRMIHYPMVASDRLDDHRGGEHTDYGSITLLWRFDDTGGLQVEDRQTGEWIEAPPVENSIVLNVADMFQRWSNDTLRSTNHRVINTDHTKSRYTMPYFVDPGRDVLIKNFTEEPDKHPPIFSEEYLQDKIRSNHDETNWERQTN
jgi:isopenicillin N synthase-like dioxygenase